MALMPRSPFTFATKSQTPDREQKLDLGEGQDPSEL
jgi:hypothetical protein